MSFELTKAALLKTQEATKEPQLVIQIDGVDTIYGSTELLEYIRVGDVGLFIDGTWKIGGLRAVEDQSSALSLGNDAGTTTKITQTLDAERGRGSSVQTMTIGLIDKNQEITRLISPSEVVDDVMGRRARVYLGFNNTGFKRDFIPVFKGIIDDVQSGPGLVRLSLGSPEQKKRQDIFQKSQTNTTSAINNSQTTIPVVATTNFLGQGIKPDGSPETSLKTYIRIDDEIIEYTGLTSNSFTGCVRGSLGTSASSHDDDATVDSFYRLGPDNIVDLSLKVMLGGRQDYFITGVTPKNFEYLTPTESIPNAIYFDGIDVDEEYGLAAGDYVTSSGSALPANNFTMKTIQQIVKIDTGSYMILDGVDFDTEVDTAATLSFRSQWDTLPIGAGLAMLPDDVDVDQHIQTRTLFFTSFDLDIYINDTINGKDFIEKEIYLPGGMFSVPRKARSSVSINTGPVPGANTVTLDETNVMNPAKLTVRRSLGKNFYNSVVYSYDQEPLDLKFLSSRVTIANDSLTRIPVGPRTLKIEAKGIRSELNAVNIVTQASNRRLQRYKFAAEFLENVVVSYGVGFNIEVSDVVILDGRELAMSDSNNAKRGMEPRLFQVINKTLDVKLGQVTLNLVDTAYSTQNRYALISPSSRIKSGVSTTQFIIENDGLYSKYGVDEGRKWSKMKRPFVKIRSEDWTFNETVQIANIVGNTVTLLTPLSVTPSAGYWMELSKYNDSTEQVKLLYGWMRDTDPFDDNKARYLML